MWCMNLCFSDLKCLPVLVDRKLRTVIVLFFKFKQLLPTSAIYAASSCTFLKVSFRAEILLVSCFWSLFERMSVSFVDVL